MTIPFHQLAAIAYFDENFVTKAMVGTEWDDVKGYDVDGTQGYIAIRIDNIDRDAECRQKCAPGYLKKPGCDTYKFFAIPRSNSEHIGRQEVSLSQEWQKCDDCHQDSGNM